MASDLPLKPPAPSVDGAGPEVGGVARAVEMGLKEPEGAGESGKFIFSVREGGPLFASTKYAGLLSSQDESYILSNASLIRVPTPSQQSERAKGFDAHKHPLTD